MEKVEVVEVKRAFVLANAGNELFNENEDPKTLSQRFRELKVIHDNYSEEKLNEEIKDKVRLRRYDEIGWHKGYVPLINMGPWPKMGGLPIDFTTGNIVDTANMFISHSGTLEETLSLKKIKKVTSIRENSKLIRVNFPLILVPGGEVRENEYNVWARENEEPLCDIFKYGLDDGNHRALAYTPEYKTALAFVGNRVRSSSKQIQ